MEDKIEKLKCTPLSETDILKKLNGRTYIYKYNELVNFKSIDEMLGSYGNCVILLESEENFGHWVCVKRTGSTISFLDSYGKFPDKQKQYINKEFLVDSGQQYNQLCQLLFEASFKYTIEFSERPLQDIRKPEIATCGHWCCVFILSGVTVDEFYEFIDSFHMKDKDTLVVMLFYNLPVKNPTANKRMRFN